jgi:hypothetical protein
MKTIERWFFGVADSDWNWIGLSWLRPAKDARIGIGYVIGSSILLGLPSIGAGAAMLYFTCGRVSLGTWLFLIVAATMAQLLLHTIFAHFWNRRASKVMRNVAA